LQQFKALQPNPTNLDHDGLPLSNPTLLHGTSMPLHHTTMPLHGGHASPNLEPTIAKDTLNPSGATPDPIHKEPLRRSTRIHHSSSCLIDYATTVEFFGDLQACFVAFMESIYLQAFVIVLKEPLFYKDVATNPHWITAMEQEMTSICANGTWTLVELPPRHTTIPIKWTYKLKLGAASKVQLVA